MGGGFSILFLLISVFLHELRVIQCSYGNDLLNRIAPETSPDVQEEAVRQLIERVVGKRSARLFDVEVNKVLAERSYQVGIDFKIDITKFNNWFRAYSFIYRIMENW